MLPQLLRLRLRLLRNVIIVILAVKAQGGAGGRRGAPGGARERGAAGEGATARGGEGPSRVQARRLREAQEPERPLQEEGRRAQRRRQGKQ